MKAASLPGEQPTKRRWVMFSLACGTSWFLYLHRYTWNIVRVALRDDYEFSNTTLGTLEACFNFTYTAGQIPSGILGDLFGTFMLLGILILAWSLVLPLFGLTGNVYGLGALRMFFGASQAGCYPNLAKVTRNWIPLSSRTTCQGMIASFFGRFGGAMSTIIMATLLMGICGLSWRWALVVMSAAGVLFAIAFFLFFRNSPEEDPRVNQAELDLIREGEEEAEEEEESGAVLHFGQAIRNRSMAVFIFQQFMNAGADFIYVALMGSYFIDRGFGFAAVGILASLPLFGGAIGGLVGGVLNDVLIARTGNRRWSRTAVGFTGKFIAAGVMLVAISQSNGYMAAGCFFMVKFFTDWSQPTVWGTCTDMGGRCSASVFSIINTAGGIGGITMVLFAGPFLDYFTTETIVEGQAKLVTDYNPLFMIVAGMYVLSALSWFFIDCTNRLDGVRPSGEENRDGLED
ncbi:MAG: MFS transporter [Pirellulaceae bacterium]|nr:MFS transporter [Pirellulaceae bacterium]